MKRAFDFLEMGARSEKPRQCGLTMVLDKGLGPGQARDLTTCAPWVDIVKLGWATPRLFSEDVVREKTVLYRQHGIMVGNGGTMLEIACHQNRLDLFFDYCQDIGIELIEVSNGVLPMTLEEKSEIIRRARALGFRVISEVGKKDPGEDHKLSLEDRIAEARSDLEAGAAYVIIEAREGGRSLGVYDDSGCLIREMARTLVQEIGSDRIMFEAPDKSQQLGLILMFGPDVNLGNIRPEDAVPLETLRRGIRGDTFGKL